MHVKLLVISLFFDLFFFNILLFSLPSEGTFISLKSIFFNLEEEGRFFFLGKEGVVGIPLMTSTHFFEYVFIYKCFSIYTLCGLIFITHIHTHTHTHIYTHILTHTHRQTHTHRPLL